MGYDRALHALCGSPARLHAEPAGLVKSPSTPPFLPYYLRSVSLVESLEKTG